MGYTQPAPENPDEPDLSEYYDLPDEDFLKILEEKLISPMVERKCTCRCHSDAKVEHFSPCCCQHGYMWVCPECRKVSD